MAYSVGMGLTSLQNAELFTLTYGALVVQLIKVSDHHY